MKQAEIEAAVGVLKEYRDTGVLPFRFGFCTRCKTVSRFDDARTGCFTSRRCLKCKTTFSNKAKIDDHPSIRRPNDSYPLNDYIVEKDGRISTETQDYILLLNSENGQKDLVKNAIERLIQRQEKIIEDAAIEIERLHGLIEIL